MKFSMAKALPLLALLSVSTAFGSTAYTFTSNSGSNSYKVIITVDSLGIGGTGDLIVQLINNTAASTNAADTTMLSGVYFTLSGSVGALNTPTSWYSGTSSSDTSDPVVTLSQDGTYTTTYTNLSQMSSSALRWKNLGSGDNVDLSTLTGGSPNELIMGALGGTFNHSVTNHNPTIVGGATFVFANVAGISSATTVSSVYFDQGTAASPSNANGPNTETAALTSTVTTAAPEPASFGLIGLGLAGVTMLARKRRA